jgi:hypothetical protein
MGLKAGKDLSGAGMLISGFLFDQYPTDLLQYVGGQGLECLQAGYPFGWYHDSSLLWVPSILPLIKPMMIIFYSVDVREGEFHLFRQSLQGGLNPQLDFFGGIIPCLL